MGYAGGTTPRPTYKSIGDHSEAIEIVYDPGIISFRELLDEFWEGHDPTRAGMSSQYRSVIFFSSDSRKRTAEMSLAETGERVQKKIHTEIEPLSGFTQAENYHQKYYLQMQESFKDEFLKLYPRLNDLLRSTAASRVNGFAGGYGSGRELEKVIHSLGLSERNREKLRMMVSRSYR